MSFTDQEIQEFKAEVLEILESAEKSLLAIDEGASYCTEFDTVFRGLHNIKGSSGMMELPKLQAHAHELESILMRFKNTGSMPKDYISLFLRGIDAARSLLEGKDISFEYTAVESATTPVVEKVMASPLLADLSSKELGGITSEFISESEEIIERLSINFQKLEDGSFSKESVDSLYRDVHSLKGSSYLFSYNKLGDIAHAMESSLEKVRNATHSPSPSLINLLYKSLEVIEGLVGMIKSNSPDDEQGELVKNLSQALIKASDKLEPILASTPTITQNSKNVDTEANSSIRVSVSLLDSLMTLMGEMVLVRNQVLQFANHSEDLEFLSMSNRLSVVTNEIQGEMMKTRMQPIGNVLSKFNRVVRDLSQELNKSIHLEIIGSETELDKSLLEAIKDPLTHIVRNSCDHGLETPSIRAKTGKPETGTILIKAYHEGGQVVVEVTDDGKGLNKDVLLKKAVEKNLFSPDQASKLNEKEIFNIIFDPGFSTAAQVTNVSGRGVGMDVVRTNIEKIGGSVDLASREGFGTTIKIKIPLTLAIVPALLVKCGDGTFAIPQVKLEELVRVDQSTAGNKIEMLHGSPVFRLRGNILPLVNLGQLLNLNQKKSDFLTNGVINIAVLNAEQNSFGVIIDEVLDSADIVVKPLNRLLKSLQVYSGATVLGDGSVALIFDVLGISKLAHMGLEKSASENTFNHLENVKRKVSENQDFIILRLNSPTKHAIILGAVHRLEEFSQNEIEISGNQRVIRYRNMILPLISANTQLGYPSAQQSEEKLSVIVVERAGSLYGIEVDSVLDTLSTEAETVPSLGKHPGIYGNLNMEDEMIVVVDPFELIFKAFPELAPPPVITPLAGGPNGFAPPSFNGTKRILVVEDTVFFKRAIKEILEKAGYEVLTASDGEEALEILRTQGKFQLIVSDIEMPRINGFQLASQVRKTPSIAQIPMLAMSSRADQKYRKDGLDAGFDIYLEKMRPEVLLAAADQLLFRKVAIA
jgi:two-component system, chemotaxis family, sensor kinase CheA